jgi:nucleoside-diphosphate-sugar epimerase
LTSSTALVTGASGFIGRHLVRALRARGVEVAGVSRREAPVDIAGVRWSRADLADAAAVDRIVAETRPEVIYHLASHVVGRRELAEVRPAFAANLASTVNLLVAATAAGTGRIVLAGSMEEPALADGEAPSSPYAAAKGAASLYAGLFRALYATPLVTARIFMVYGPGQRDESKLVPYAIRRALAGEAPAISSGARPVDWIYVDDVVAGLVALGEKPGLEGETVDLGSGELVTVREVVERICRQAGGPPPAVGALADRPLEAVRRADVARTATRLGWRPEVGLDEGLARTIAAMRAQAIAGVAGAAGD